jgi:hypothetical protein
LGVDFNSIGTDGEQGVENMDFAGLLTQSVTVANHI